MKQLSGIVLLLFLCLSVVKAQAPVIYCQSYEWHTGFRDTLPAWVFTPDTGCFVGMSDPGLKPEVGREQAIQRALFFRLLAGGTRINVVFDYFTSVHQDQQDGKFIVLAALEGGQEEVSYTVEKEYVSAFGEVFVALREGTEGAERTAFSYSGELMMVENKENREKREFKILLTFYTPRFEKLQQSVFSYRGNGEYARIGQCLNDEEVYIPRGRYMYADAGYSTGEYEETYQLFDSYWCGLAESLLNEITLYSFPSVNIRRVNDTYHSAQRELKREVVCGSLSAVLQAVGVKGNQLNVKWKCEGKGN